MNRSVAETEVGVGDPAGVINYVERVDRYRVTSRVGGGKKHVRFVATALR